MSERWRLRINVARGALAVLAWLGGCTETTDPTRPVAQVLVTPASATTPVGATLQLTATLRDAAGRVLTDRAVTWTSSDSGLATVSATGMIAALDTGAVTIIATSEGKAGNAAITVTPPPVDSVDVAPRVASLLVGATVQLVATAFDAAGHPLTGRSVTWTSANAAVAAVSGGGFVTAVALGTTVISATSEGKIGTATIVVSAVPIDSIFVTPAADTIEVGAFGQFTATALDSNGTPLPSRVVSWTSSDPGVATVSQAGVAAGVAPGGATITASGEGKSGSASLIVQPAPTPVPPELLLSDPVVPSTASLVAGAAASASGGDSTVFISVQPGLVPTGVSALIVNHATGLSVTTQLARGGFDPVPLKGDVGDSVEITVRDQGQTVVFHVTLKVGDRRPPVIVRTEPPPKKTDVPLNAALIVVFSEPITTSALTTASLRLMQGASPVAGTVQFLDSAHLTAQFAPAAPLAPGTAYQLIVTPAILDLSGDPLATTQTIDFTTGAGSAQQAVWDVKVNPSAATILQNQTLQLAATAWSVGDSFQVYGHPVTWASGDPGVATVSGSGLVTGVATGVVGIGATIDGVGAVATITVIDSQVVSVVVSPDMVVVPVADSFQLQVVLRDGVGNVVTGRPVSWTSSAPTVATVTPSGLVHGVAAGSATITATSEKGSGFATIAVQDGPILNVADLWDWTASEWVGGSACADTGTFWLDQRDGTPFGGTVWSVGSCSASRWPLIRGLVVGTTLGFSWENDSCHFDGTLEGDPPLRFTGTESCYGGSETRAVEARRHEPAGAVAVLPAAKTVILGGSTGLQIVAHDTAGRPVFGRSAVWSSDNPAVATVSASGQVTGVSAGTATISATVEGLTATAAITVESVTFTAVGAGYLNCGLSTGGAVYCWGDTPIRISDTLTFTSLSVGLGQACGLVAGGAAYCWGASSNTPEVVPGGLSFSSVTAGWYHACGLTAAGAAYCWGLNDSGQVGNGQMSYDEPAPVAVLGGLTFTSLSAGVRHTCGIATGGAAYCWGANYFNQLGASTYPDLKSLVPVQVVGGRLFRSIAAGPSHTCAIDLQGELYCWGSYWYGEQGITDPYQGWPGRAVAGGPFAAVSVGGVPTSNSWDASYTFGFSCGITVAGAGMCWGWNGYGQLGDGSVTQRPTPTAVAGGLAFASISTGRVHSCALTTAGVAYCWGAPGNGDGTMNGSAVPVRVLGHP